MKRDTLHKNLPETPGVYLMKDAEGRVIYVGKAGNLRRRVSSYFMRVHDLRIESLVNKIKRIDYKKTGSALEALILESELIKKHTPQFNVKEKDDKSFLYIKVTKEDFPRVLLVRGKDKTKNEAGQFFGPFTSASSAREALKIVRRIFPYSVHRNGEKLSRPCFDYQVGLCPGTCIGEITKKDYSKIAKNIILFFDGKKKKVLSSLKKEMKFASKNLEFEKAVKIRRQIFALEHIRDVALINDSEVDQLLNVKGQMLTRIEGYDISNISGTSSVGSMVVFEGGKPNKSEYKKFKIRTIRSVNDIGMLKEVFMRRLNNDWKLPDLILVDGGVGQVNAANKILSKFGLRIPVVGIAKGPKRKRNDFYGRIPRGTDKNVLIRVRDEAHRFAISYHRKLRDRI